MKTGGGMDGGVCAPGVNRIKYEVNGEVKETCMCEKDYEKLAKKKGVAYKNNDLGGIIKGLEKAYESTKCGKSDHSCWFDKDLPHISVDKLKPITKSGKYEWLNTKDIEKVLLQYEVKHPEFKFMGAHPIDFQQLRGELDNLDLDKYKGKTKIGFVFNLDPSYKQGSHWVAYFIDRERGEIMYFDSFAPRESRIPPEIKECSRKLIEKHGYKSRINQFKYQKGNSECGVFSIMFIISKINGYDLDYSVDDSVANKSRTDVFRRVSKNGRGKVDSIWPVIKI